MRIYENDYNHRIAETGRQLKAMFGIINPTKSILKAIEEKKSELKNEFEKFEVAEPHNFKHSTVVSYFEKYLP